MKKSYETPSVEVMKFQYSDQVVAASAPLGTYLDGDLDGYCDPGTRPQ